MDAKKLESLDLEVLKEMAKELNKATYKKDGVDTLILVGKKVKTIAITKEGLAVAFDAAIQEIVKAGLGAELPEEMIDYYNTNFAAEETAPAAAATAATAAEKTKKEKPPKEAKPPKEPKPKAELSVFGHKVGSQAAALDDLLAPGTPISLDDLEKKSGRSKLGVKSHIKHLQTDRKLTINEKDGVYQLVKTESAKA
jgi:hypothetical protein